MAAPPKLGVGGGEGCREAKAPGPNLAQKGGRWD